MRQSVDWDAVLRSREHPELAPHIEIGASAATEAVFGVSDEEDDDGEKGLTPEVVSGPLTVGLIGTYLASFEKLELLTLILVARNRSTKCRQIFVVECALWTNSCKSITNTGEGESSDAG